MPLILPPGPNDGSTASAAKWLVDWHKQNHTTLNESLADIADIKAKVADIAEIRDTTETILQTLRGQD